MNETATCPHCGQLGIVVSRFYYSRGFSRGWPATCRKCGALAYDGPHGIVTSLGCLFDLLGVPLFFVLLVLFPGTVSVALLSAIPFLIFYWWRHRGQSRTEKPFRPISPESSLLSRRLTYLAILAALVAFGVFLFAAFRPR